MMSQRWVLALFAVTVMIWHEPAGGQPPLGRGEPRGAGPPGPRFGMLRFALLDAMDIDRDGTLSREEIENASRALAALDQDGDGKLSAAEIGWPPAGLGPGGGGGPGRGWGPPGFGPNFGQGVFPPGPQGPPVRPDATEPAAPADLVERLMAYDRDGDGRVTKMELPRSRHAILDQADTNQDGAVDRDELTAYVERMNRDEAASDPAP